MEHIAASRAGASIDNRVELSRRLTAVRAKELRALQLLVELPQSSEELKAMVSHAQAERLEIERELAAVEVATQQEKFAAETAQASLGRSRQ
jgi:hypothetical protein